jgi:hypothetical protein
LYVDVSIGYWLHRGSPCSKISGLAPIFEVHWNSSLEDSAFVEQNGFRVGNSAGQIDLVNLVAGLVIECGGNTTITAAYTDTVIGDDDRDFDGEFRLIFNHRFGPQSRASRAQF